MAVGGLLVVRAVIITSVVGVTVRLVVRAVHLVTVGALGCVGAFGGLRLRRFLGKFFDGPRDGVFVDLGGRDDLVDGGEHAIPVAPDDFGEHMPAFAAGPAGEVGDPTRYRRQRRVAVEELRYRGQFADRPQGRHDAQRRGDGGDGGFGRLLGDQFLDSDQVEAVVVGRGERVGAGGGHGGPRRVVLHVVVAVSANEGHQIGHGVEREQGVVAAQERFPLVPGVTPAGCPQGVAVTFGQAEADG